MKDLMMKETKQDFVDMLVLTLGVILLPGVMVAVITIAGVINFEAGMACNLIVSGFFAAVLIFLGVYLVILGIKDYKRDLAFVERNFK